MPGNSLAAVAALVVLPALTSLPTTLVGQEPADASRGGLRLGAEIGVAPELDHRLDDDCANAAFLFGARGSLRFLEVLALESSTRVHVEVPAECVTLAPVPPIPGEGPYTDIRIEVEDRGYPIVSTDARLAVEPFVLTAPVSVRAFAGAGGMWGKWIPYTLAGVGLRIDVGAVDVALEAERWWFEVTELRFEREFMDGQPVSEEELVASRDIAQRMDLLHLAVELGL